MITLLSPFARHHTIPVFIKESAALINELRKLESLEIQKLMAVSSKIAEVNVDRYQKFKIPFTVKNSKQALCAFSGDVYSSMELSRYNEDDFFYAQDHLCILSGLYGCLRPLDLIQPSRLEMKTKLANKRGPDLYTFWGADYRNH